VTTGNAESTGEVTISAQVLSIDEFRLKRAPDRKLDDCKHYKLVRDDDLQTVECSDCGKNIGTYAALIMLVSRLAKLQRHIDIQSKIAAEAMEKTITLRAAQRVEAAWRSHTMSPTCPHCHEAIFATDGFGSSTTNKEIALRRRAVTVAAKNTQRAVTPRQSQGEPG
jgi:hypothetical protein